MRTSTTRKVRAYSLLAQGKVDKISDVTYRVWSQSGSSHYIVIKQGLEWICECPGCTLNHVTCKHIHAVAQYELNQRNTYSLESEGEKLFEPEPEIEDSVSTCKFCGSEHIVKRGYRTAHRGKVQRFFCNDCKHKFIVDEGFEKMKATPETVSVALDLYFKGISMKAIVDHLQQFYSVEVSHVAVYKWLRKYVKVLKQYADQLVPKVSGIWHSDEMVLKVRNLDNHENQRWAWNVIDNQSRYWLATQITKKREIADARKVLAQTSTVSQTKPMAVVTDGLRAYQDAITRVLHFEGSKNRSHQNTQHKRQIKQQYGGKTAWNNKKKKQSHARLRR
jgi:putative transposase